MGDVAEFINRRISGLLMAYASRQNQRRFLTAIILFVCLMIGLGQTGTAWGATIFRLSIPDQRPIPNISQIAASPDGYLWAMVWPSRIKKFDPSNSRFIVTVGGTGTGDGQFFVLGGMAVDHAGSVYASDVNLSRLQKFDSNGNFVLKWKNFYAASLAVDISGNIYALTSYFVYKGSRKGELLTYWGGKGTGDGQFSYPSAIAVDILGNVYVADVGNQRIQKFDSNGSFLTKWGTEGTGVTVDSSSNVYVSGYHSIWKFDSHGSFLEKWGTRGREEGFFSEPNKAVADSAGNIYVADTGNHRIQKFDSNGNFLVTWGSYGSGDGQFSEPSHVAINSSGDVYVVDRWNDRIQKFDSNGNFLAKWGSHGSEKGEFITPNGVAVDNLGIVYVADYGNGRIQKFDGNGNFIKQWGIWVPIYHCYTSCFWGSCSDDCTDVWFPNPTDIALDTAGNVYLLHSGRASIFDIDSEVFKYDSNGRFLARWGSPGNGDGQFGWYWSGGWGPGGIATDSADNVYVADTENNRIQKFGNKGNFLAAWGTLGTGAGHFVAPHGIAVDSAGNAYVADTGNHRIQKFEQTFQIRGTVRTATGDAISGVSITLSGDANETVTTDSSGMYKFKDVPNGSYTVTPERAGYDFTPSSTNVAVYGRVVAKQNFTGATFAISGSVRKANGTPMAGVLITQSGDASEAVTTDSNGVYRFKHVANGNYTITPSKTGFTFAPADITLDMNGASVKGQNFTGVKN